MTFQQLAGSYLAKHLSKKSSHSYYVRLFTQYFAGWTEHPSRFEIRAWHLAHAETPTHSNKALGFLKAMYGWAQNTGDVTGKAALWGDDNPARGVRRHSTNSRERVLSDTELVQLFTFLDFTYQKLSTFITILLCTGCRMSEARTMKWSHVDLLQGYWFKPMTKNGMSQRIPLTRQAIAALEAMKREGDYVFMGIYDRCWSRCGAEKAWSKFRKGPGLDDLTLHDFRRTVASRIYEQTKDEKLIKAIINHRDSSMSGVYIRMQYKRIAEALQAHADAVWVLHKEVSYVSPLSASQPMSAAIQLCRRATDFPLGPKCDA